MSPSGDNRFRLDELSLQASALRAQILERCRRTLSHDLNNAVQSIHSGLELLSKCVNSPGTLRVTPQECLNLLQQQFANLQTTFRNLLSDIAEPPADPERVDVSAVLQAVLQTLRHERSISKAKVSIDPGLFVVARKINLRSILFGTLFDAIDHMQRDAIVSVRAVEQDRVALLEVRVEGVATAANLPPQEVALSDLLQRLVRAEGGELHVETSPEQYVLALTLPCASKAATDNAPSQTTSAKVLIADRNRDAADSLAMILQLEGHIAQTIYVGTELRAALDTFSPDIVLIDSDLPGCNPVEMANAVRARSGKRPLFAQVSSTDRSAHSAFDANLIRPVEWPQLQSLLKLRKSENEH